MERTVGVNPYFALLGQGKDHAHMEIQAVAVPSRRPGQVHRFLGRNLEAVHEVAEAQVHGRTRNVRTPQHVLAAHRKQKSLEVVALAHGHRKTELVERKSTATAMVNQIQAAALPRFHLGKNRTYTIAIAKIFLNFRLYEGIVQKAFFPVSMGMHIAKHRLRHALKKFAQS